MGGKEVTLKVRHERLGARVEGVDDHLAVGRTSDLDASVFEPGRGDGADPGGVGADVRGLGREVELCARIESALGGVPGREQLQVRGRNRNDVDYCQFSIEIASCFAEI